MNCCYDIVAQYSVMHQITFFRHKNPLQCSENIVECGEEKCKKTEKRMECFMVIYNRLKYSLFSVDKQIVGLGKLKKFINMGVSWFSLEFSYKYMNTHRAHGISKG